ncbi:hypothetical protein PT974_06872 [Cladobotryum mycophilum]|uniref:PH domain-containing protein n=1 Tax=Cladobotryum mycophilum TaxID=491253 RepID=A0ABR0SNX3_9HYPO
MAAAGTTGALLPPPEPPQKTSRYRSLRGKSVSSRFNLFRDPDAQDPPVPRIRSKSVAGIRNASISKPVPMPTDIPPIPNFALSSKSPRGPKPPQSIAGDDDTRTPPSPPRSPRSLATTTTNTTLEVDSPLTKTEREIDELAAQLDLEVEAAQRKKEAEQKRKEEEEAARYAAEVARLEAETDRILAEQRKLDLARLQAQLSTPPQKPKRVILDKLTFLGRSKKSNTSGSQPPSTPSTIAPTIFTPDLSRSSSIEGSPPPERMSFIEPALKSDTPLSAINGGERRITVRCMSSTIHLEVTADTSPVDILKMTARMTRHDLDFDTTVIIECFIVLGLERKLRRYERIRDVMNSWDRDNENSLLITAAEATDNLKELELAGVPRTDEPVSGFTLQLYHSSRPGKWTKRFVTLLTTGQMFAAKRAECTISDKDSTSLCHLSDFDIYKPKESETKRNLKPPKRFCYAIKSQQKTVVFPNGENYVHFFSTDDVELADRFYELVHGWRSWYLVNRQVKLRTKEKPPQLTFNFDLSRPATSSGVSVMVPETPLLSAGSFMDESDFTKAIEESTKKLALEAQRNKSLAKRKPSTVSVAPTVRSEREFAPEGLLGQAYEKRKEEVVAEAKEEATKTDKEESPFTEGPNLLNGLASPVKEKEPEVEKPEVPEARSWFPSAAEHSARVRSPSIHQPRRPVTADASAQPPRKEAPAPLLNFPEPPRSRDGPRGPASAPGSRQGHGLRPPAGSPLINYATGGPPGMPPKSLGPPPPGGPPPPPSVRGRSRSTAGPISNGRRGPPPEDLPPMPPMGPHGSNGPRRPGDRMPRPPRDGPPHDGPPRDGPSRDGPSRDGPPRDGPPRDGPPRDGPRDGPPRGRDPRHHQEPRHQEPRHQDPRHQDRHHDRHDRHDRHPHHPERPQEGRRPEPLVNHAR